MFYFWYNGSMEIIRKLVKSRQRNRVVKTCVHCNATFDVQPSKENRYVMCAKCRKQRYHAPITLMCHVCGKPFTRKGHDTKAKYCSPACRWHAMKGRPSGRRYLPDRICLICGTPYRQTQSSANQFYCSSACFRISQQQARPQYECIQCGALFYNDTGRKEPQFCSRKCKGMYISGPRHPLWTDIRPIGDRGAGWEQIADAIRQRDNYQCQRCGIIQAMRKLDVHHITPYRLTQDNNPNNLITLCGSCHKIVETETNRQPQQS